MSFLMWSALTGMILTFLGSIAAAFLSLYLKKRIGNNIYKQVIRANNIVKLELRNDTLAELNRIIEQKSLKVNLTSELSSKKGLFSVTIIPKDFQSKHISDNGIQLLFNNNALFVTKDFGKSLRIDLALEQAFVFVSILAFFLVMLAFYVITRASTALNLISVAITPILLVLAILLPLLFNKFRKIKVSR